MLKRGVDRIGTHRVTHVQNKMHHKKAANRGLFDNASLDITRATTTLNQSWGILIDERQKFSLVFLQQSQCRIGFRQIQNLKLTNHLLAGHTGFKTTRSLRQFCHKRSPGYNRWLFNHHRHQNGLTIDHKVLGDANWQAIHANRVFNHCIRCVRLQSTFGRIGLQIRVAHLGVLKQVMITFRQAELVKFLIHRRLYSSFCQASTPVIAF